MGYVWRVIDEWAQVRPGGMNQTEIAKVLGVSPQSVSKYKNGTALPEARHLPGYSEATKIPQRVLFEALMHDKGGDPDIKLEPMLAAARRAARRKWGLRAPDVEESTG